MKSFHGFQILIAVVFMIMSSIFGVWSTLIHMEMVDRLNEKLPVDQRFNVLWWGPFKRERFLEQYDQEFPNDPLKKRLWRFGGLMFGFFVIAILDLTFLSTMGSTR